MLDQFYLQWPYGRDTANNTTHIANLDKTWRPWFWEHLSLDSDTIVRMLEALVLLSYSRVLCAIFFSLCVPFAFAFAFSCHFCYFLSLKIALLKSYVHLVVCNRIIYAFHNQFVVPHSRSENSTEIIYDAVFCKIHVVLLHFDHAPSSAS